MTAFRQHGWRIRRGMANAFDGAREFATQSEPRRYVKLISERPDDPALHRLLANAYARRRNWIPAIAEYRTSIALGGAESASCLALARAYRAIGQVDLAISTGQQVVAQAKDSSLAKEARHIIGESRATKPRPLSRFDANRYYRLMTLANHIGSVLEDSTISVLDVGGGDGALCLFLPEAHYVLAEPSMNGISGINLPFRPKSFDIVVACHVLEHVDHAERSQFIRELCSMAREYVLLLNPFTIPGVEEASHLELVLEITGASWASEHLNCGLPDLGEVRHFADESGFALRVLPNGSMATSLALEFLSHYASAANCQHELEKINDLFNVELFDQLTNPQLPTAYLIEIGVHQSQVLKDSKNSSEQQGDVAQ